MGKLARGANEIRDNLDWILDGLNDDDGDDGNGDDSSRVAPIQYRSFIRLSRVLILGRNDESVDRKFSQRSQKHIPGGFGSEKFAVVGASLASGQSRTQVERRKADREEIWFETFQRYLAKRQGKAHSDSRDRPSSCSHLLKVYPGNFRQQELSKLPSLVIYHHVILIPTETRR